MKNRKRKKKIIIIPSIILILIITLFSYFNFSAFGQNVKKYINDGYAISEKLDENSINSDKPTTIYDVDKNKIKEFNSQANYKVDNNNVNPILKKGFIAVEDKRFYNHNGVDLYSLGRAVSQKILGRGLQGGSTITQQLVKNKILNTQEQSLSRKITEMVIAQELEKKFSKEEIIISYLNNIWFGDGALGVGRASKTYFNKDQKDLTIRESAVIISLTNNPTLYHPEKNKINSDKKVAEILNKMKKENVITDSEYNQAMSEETVVNKGTIDYGDNKYTDNYAVSYAINESAKKMLEQDGFIFKFKFKNDQEYKDYHTKYNLAIQEKIDKILNGGFDIYTSINQKTQKDLEYIVNNQLAKYKETNEGNIYNLQTSITVLNNKTHNVEAIIGGRGTEKDELNRAYQSFRQPGSTAKLIVAYTPAFERGVLPQSIFYDGKVDQFPHVRNANGGFYNRNFTVREAVDWSINTIALKVAIDNDKTLIEDKLARMKFSHLHPKDKNDIIAIGGFTYGVSSVEMAGAYSTLTNNGNFVNPSNIEKIVDKNNLETIYSNSKESEKIYSKEASYAMLDVLKTSGSGYTLLEQPTLASNYPKEYQGAKTGTTDNYKDSYLVSVNNYYTTSVWVGADNNRTLTELEQKESKILNKKITEYLLKNKKPIDFQKPDTVEKNKDIITFKSQENTSGDLKNDSKFKIENQLSELRKENADRLLDEEYRIVFGLTKIEEKLREDIVISKIKRIETKTISNIEDYHKVKEDIAEIQVSLLDVKSAKKNKELKEILKKLEERFLEEYKEVVSRKEIQYKNTLDKEKEKIRKEKKLKNSSEIEKLKEDLEKIKEKITRLPQESYIKEMDEIITKLNELGEEQKYYDILTDGSSKIEFIPK